MPSSNGRPRRYAYLGPSGTFTEAAARTLPEAADAELVPCGTVPAALDAVRSGDAGGAVVPLENSVEGSVATTLDELATGELLHIRAEILLPVSFALMARPGTVLADIRTVATHPHAEAQCRAWLRHRLPDAAVEFTTSTAAGAAAIAKGRSPAGTAAIAAPLAAERYGLQVLASDLGSASDAVTRFLLVTPPGAPPPPTGADRTTVVAFIADDHPGALLELLTEFAVRGVNLTRIESRPTGSGLGRYYFSVDCEGSIAEARVGEALSALRRVCAEVRFLGSYPRGDAQPTAVRPGTTEEDFRAAREWLSRLRDGRS